MPERVHRVRIPAVEVEGYPDLWNYSPQLDPERPAVEPGIWRPLAEAESLIDPNDPAVRERVIQALAEDVDDRWHLPAADLEAVAHEMTDAVLAALRGAK